MLKSGRSNLARLVAGPVTKKDGAYYCRCHGNNTDATICRIIIKIINIFHFFSIFMKNLHVSCPGFVVAKILVIRRIFPRTIIFETVSTVLVQIIIVLRNVGSLGEYTAFVACKFRFVLFLCFDTKLVF